jgi:hypothetical protein
MRTQHIVVMVAFAAAAFTFNRCVLDGNSAPARPAEPAKVRATKALPHAAASSSWSPPARGGPASAPAQDERPRADDGTPPAVLALAGHTFASREEERAAYLDQLRASGGCAAAACAETRDALQRRVMAAAALGMGAVDLRSLDCYGVGCVASIDFTGEQPVMLAIDKLERDESLRWSGPTVFTAPIRDADGRQNVTWIFLHVTPND